MHDEVAEGDVLGGFEGALDLVHGGDAARLVRVRQIDGGSAGAAHLAIGIKRGVHRPGLEGIRAEPRSQLTDVFAAGVVEVLTRGKDFDRLRARAAGGTPPTPRTASG